MKNKKGSFVVEVLITVIVAVVAAVLLRTFVLNPFVVAGGSMDDTLYGGVFKGYNKDGVPVYEGSDVVVLYRQGKFERGDMIVFDAEAFLAHTQGDAETLIKRVVATGGRTIRIERTEEKLRSTVISGEIAYVYGAAVYVDDELIEEDYLPEAMEFSLNWSEDGYAEDNLSWSCSVPENAVFAMGDNRNNSTDSRVNGAVSLEEKDYIKGKVIAIYNTTSGRRSFRFPK